MDVFGSWRGEMERKLGAGQEDLESELAEGAGILEGVAAGGLRGADRRDGARRGGGPARRRPGRPSAPPRRSPPRWRSPWSGRRRARSACARPLLEVDVDRERARMGAWYELFPRSFGGLAGVEAQLPALAELGFDVVYLPPIHPIGVTHRKGRNNSPTAAPGEPGSPWAIGAAEGGHTAVSPELGTLADVESLVAAARANDIEIALDFAIQCSPDHPWLTEHPDWFHRRPDGTLKYAENPPKRYQDIYNVNFASDDWQALWDRPARRGELLGGARRAHLPGRQSPHQADRLLGVADPLGARGAPGRGLPGRGLHQPRPHVRARQGRLQPVVHLLHLEELGRRS